MRHMIYLCLLLMLSTLCIDVSFAQMMSSEVYELDPLAKNSDSKDKQAFYFMNMGLRELERLEQQAATGFLDDDSKIRKEQLKTALASVKAAMESLGEPGQTAEKHATLKYLMTDVINSEIVFSAIGQERAVALANERALKIFNSQKENSKEFSYSPTTVLKSGAFVKLLGLSDEQEKQLEELLETSTEKMKTCESMKNLQDALANHWKQLLASLEASQKEAAVRMLGEPVWWFRNGDSRRRDHTNHGQVVMSGKVTSKNGRSVYEMSPDELREQGVKFIHSHVFEMAGDRFIAEELELTDEQKSDLEKAKLGEFIALPNFSDSRLDELVNGKAELPSYLSSILLEGQEKWFLQIELQILTRKYESSVGLLHPSLANKLSLSDSQVDAIEILANNYSTLVKEFSKQLNVDRNAVQKEFDERVRDILDENQIAVFNRLVGRTHVSKSF